MVMRFVFAMAVLLMCCLSWSVNVSYADSATTNALTGEVVVHNYGHTPSWAEVAKVAKELAHNSIKKVFQEKFQDQVKQVKACVK